MPKIELTVEQLAEGIRTLSPEELETLEIILNPELRKEINDRRFQSKKDLVKNRLLSKDKLLKESKRCIKY